MRKRLRTALALSEEGAETIQLALAIPVFFVSTMAVIQLCVMAFSALTLEGGAEQAAWATDIEQLQKTESPEDANALVLDLVKGCSFGLDPEKLSVSGASFTSTDIYSKPPTPQPIANRNVICDEENRYQLAQMVRETTAGLIEFDVRYELPTLIELPGLSHVKVTRHIARERVVSTRTEIS